MSGAEPADECLVHPGLGLVPYQQQALPLDERALPEAFTSLDDSQQDERLSQVIRVVWNWAATQGADTVQAEVASDDVPRAAMAGLRPSATSSYDWEGPFGSVVIDEFDADEP